MKRKGYLVVVAYSILFLSVSCRNAGSEIDGHDLCNSITRNSAFFNSIRDEKEVEAIRDHIMRQYGNGDDIQLSIGIVDGIDDAGRSFSHEMLNWNSISGKYSIYFGDIQAGAVSKLYTQPPAGTTLNHILACLGNPDYYSYTINPSQRGDLVGMSFWYVQLGIRIFFVIPLTDYRAHGVTENEGVTTIFNAARGNLDDLVQNATHFGYLQGYIDAENVSMTEWPGELSKVHIDISNP